MHIDRIAGLKPMFFFVPGSSPFQRLLDQGAHGNGWGRKIMEDYVVTGTYQPCVGEEVEVDDQFWLQRVYSGKTPHSWQMSQTWSCMNPIENGDIPASYVTRGLVFLGSITLKFGSIPLFGSAVCDRWWQVFKKLDPSMWRWVSYEDGDDFLRRIFVKYKPLPVNWCRTWPINSVVCQSWIAVNILLGMQWQVVLHAHW